MCLAEVDKNFEFIICIAKSNLFIGQKKKNYRLVVLRFA